MSTLRLLLCRLGIHEWRGGICFHCGQKERPEGKAAARPAGRARPACAVALPPRPAPVLAAVERCRMDGVLALSADGRRAISGSKDHTLRLWDLETGQCLHTLACDTWAQ